MEDVRQCVRLDVRRQVVHVPGLLVRHDLWRGEDSRIIQ